MPDVVIVAIITGFFSLISAFIAAYAATNKTANEMRVNQAVTNTKIDALKDEVKEHNGFARRMPALEEQMKHFSERLSIIEKKVG